MSELDNMKVGDKVFWNGGYNGIGIFTVERVTDKQIVIMRGFDKKYECRYWKKNGRAVGNDEWGTNYIDTVTPERTEQVKARLLKRQAETLRDQLKLPVSTEGLSKFIELLEQAQNLK